MSRRGEPLNAQPHATQSYPRLPKDLRFRLGDTEYMFPVFKFLRQEHALALLDRGNVHLAPISEFRDADKHSGSILDLGEGQVRLRNRYTHYEGFAKDSDGLAATEFSPYSRLRLRDFSIEGASEIDDAYIYSVARFFFSDSLAWAISERKEACVLITDMTLFLARVCELVQAAEFVGAHECEYIGRDLQETDPGRYSLSVYLLANPELAGFVKPAEYAAQREFRALWARRDGEKVREAINLDVNSVRDLCIPVDFSEIDANSLSANGPTGKPGARICLKAPDSAPTEFWVAQPTDVCTPILYRRDGEEWMMGLYYAGDDPTFRGGLFSRGSAGGVLFFLSPIGPIVGNVPLKDVDRIEFFHKVPGSQTVAWWRAVCGDPSDDAGDLARRIRQVIPQVRQIGGGESEGRVEFILELHPPVGRDSAEIEAALAEAGIRCTLTPLD